MLKLRLRKQDILVVVASTAVILLSVFMTLYLSGGLRERSGFLQGREGGYQNITFTDAVLTCEEKVRDEFGRRIKTMVVDMHSSRYDNQQYLYKIFLKVNTAPGSDATGLHYVNCFVRSANGRIGKYESWEEKVESTRPSDSQGTNLFGWPK